jgi:hypothetical protein
MSTQKFAQECSKPKNGNRTGGVAQVVELYPAIVSPEFKLQYHKKGWRDNSTQEAKTSKKLTKPYFINKQGKVGTHL